MLNTFQYNGYALILLSHKILIFWDNVMQGTRKITMSCLKLLDTFSDAI